MTQSNRMTIYADVRGYCTMRTADDKTPVRPGFVPIAHVNIPRRAASNRAELRTFYRRALGHVVHVFGL